ncbi:MAG: iron ABC transporter permease [Coriobacteriales bacterium]|jgi:iron complex transport system permease protein|nr:iron ABC transporter permease [Coriobacteriales bacterium]
MGHPAPTDVTAVSRRARIALPLMAVVLLAATVASLAVGRYQLDIPLLLQTLQALPRLVGQLLDGQTPALDNAELVVFKMRLPRVLGAILIGGSLGLAGAAFQGMFRNPMVSPDLLGASAGAGFAAACAMLVSAPVIVITGSAFLGGCAAVFLTYAISLAVGRGTPGITVLVLSGVVIGALFQACVSITKYVADPYSQLPGITFFLMGGLSSITWRDILTLLVPLAVGAFVLFLLRWRINLLALKDEEAQSLGMDTNRVRLVVILCATLITAVSVAVGGMIGWVGLVIPHFMRMLVGPDHRRLLPASLFGGALYLVVMDDLARALFAMEIPIGILTALVGAPVFLLLLLRYRGGWS